LGTIGTLDTIGWSTSHPIPSDGTIATRLAAAAQDQRE
jgi:hypothetical protein